MAREAYITGVGQSEVGVRLPRHPLLLTVELHLVDLDERRGLGRLCWRTGVADSRRNLEIAEANRLVERHREALDARRHFVECCKDRHPVFDSLCSGGHGRSQGDDRRDDQRGCRPSESLLVMFTSHALYPVAFVEPPRASSSAPPKLA